MKKKKKIRSEINASRSYRIFKTVSQTFAKINHSAKSVQVAPMGVYEGLTQIKPGMHWVSITKYSSYKIV